MAPGHAASLRLVAAIALAGAAACVAPTRYVPRGPEGGYSQDGLPDGILLVSFEANEDTPRETARIYLRYRCAELAVEAGADAYVVVDSASLERPVLAGGHGSEGSRGPGGRGGRGGGGGEGQGRAEGRTPRVAPSGELHKRLVETARIRLVRGARPEGAVDARMELRSLEPLIRR